MCKLEFTVLIVGLCSLVSSQTERPIIVTNHGYVQGIPVNNYDGVTYYAFRGIPFAQPPVGELRFMRPQPPYAWPGVLDASVEAPACYQGNSSLIESEDCLYLNVYIPQLPDQSTQNRSVMVWIYGGGFEGGDSLEATYSTARFMEYDVITVTLNYRLQELGFLSTGDDVIPGNYGIWDQIEALRWVQDNIAAFGGDPDRVTIFGQSAGAWSTSTLLLSPQASGLFTAVISESGSQILPWTYETDPLPFAQTLAAILNCPEDNSTLMLSCLQSKTAEEIFNAGTEIPNYLETGTFYFLPVLDGQLADALLPDLPINLIRNGLYNKVPYINGLTENEGGYFYENSVTYITYDRDYITNDLDQLVREYTLLTGDELTQVTSLVYEEYFSQIDLDNNTAIAQGVQDFMSDSLFNFPHFLLTALLPKGAEYPPVYNYVFAYHGYYMIDRASGMTTHGDELGYLFGNYSLDSADSLASQRLLTLWTTFAKTGNPNPTSGDVIQVTWDAVTSSDSIPYLNIGSELSMEEGFRDDRMQFWNTSIVPIVLPSY